MTQQIKELEEWERLTLDIPKHRAFTYQEKKINRMSQAELIEEWFVPTFSVDKIILWRLQEEGEKMTVRDARLIKLELENRARGDLPQALFDNIFNVFELKKVYRNLTTIEAMAIYEIKCEILVDEYGAKKVGFKRDMKALIKAIAQFRSNWERSIKNLNKSKK